MNFSLCGISPPTFKSYDEVTILKLRISLSDWNYYLIMFCPSVF